MPMTEAEILERLGAIQKEIEDFALGRVPENPHRVCELESEREAMKAALEHYDEYVKSCEAS